jgi:hypothetical protein
VASSALTPLPTLPSALMPVAALVLEPVAPAVPAHVPESTSVAPSVRTSLPASPLVPTPAASPVVARAVVPALTLSPVVVPALELTPAAGPTFTPPVPAEAQPISPGQEKHRRGLAETAERRPAKCCHFLVRRYQALRRKPP